MLSFFLFAMVDIAIAQEPSRENHRDTHDVQQAFDSQIRPIWSRLCFDCHGADKQESGVRLDNIAFPLADRQRKILENARKLIESNKMPPSESNQPTPAESKLLGEWIDKAVREARMQTSEVHGSIRRLTKSQYRNTLHDLLGLRENVTDALPPEAISKDGFTNDAQAMVLSPLQVESYLDIAATALDRCIVDEKSTPTIQSFQMEFGKSINKKPSPEKIILGANSELLHNEDYIVTERKPTKPFEYHPFAMRTQYDFIEGYQGNDTVRNWKRFEGIHHAVFACMRGTPGYPKGEAYQIVDKGLLLRPAIPSAEIFGVENTYGPKANFKISLRELPADGDFRIRVWASKYDDGLLLDPDAATQPKVGETSPNLQWALELRNKEGIQHEMEIKQSGIYQIDVQSAGIDSKKILRLQLADRHFSGRLQIKKANNVPSSSDVTTAQPAVAFLVVRLEAGFASISASYGEDPDAVNRLVFTRLDDLSPLAAQFETFEKRLPNLGVHLGLRRDCGSTLTQVGTAQRVNQDGLHSYIYEGAIRDFPSPDVETENVNYLAGIREIAVRSEYTDGRDVPRLLIRRIEFEGPILTQWPPISHKRIFVNSSNISDESKYAQEIIERFASRAFRRPVHQSELSSLMQVWRECRNENSHLVESIRRTLQVVLTSPQFLFLVERSRGPEAESLDEFELASKLSYFLWNTMPDETLFALANAGLLSTRLSDEVDRMLQDHRSHDFVDVFASEWLALDKFDVVSMDAKKFPSLTRDVKSQLRKEPAHFIYHLIRENLPIKNVINSDFIMANEVVANYYGLGDATESGLQFVPIPRGKEFGGLLSRAAIVSGLSNGRQSNPVKRGAWIASKIVSEPPDDPPPNVPQIQEQDDEARTFRQKLEDHRNQKGCVKCHLAIDPWGLPLESFDAGGRYVSLPDSQTWSQLPDGTQVKDFESLQHYLTNDRLDQVAFSFAKHLATYAVGRPLSLNEIARLQDELVQLRPDEYRAKDILQLIVRSDLFLKK